MEGDSALRGKGDMLLAELADIGVSFHDDNASPRMRFQIPQLQTGDGRKPKGTVVNDVSDRRRMRTTVSTGGSQDAVAMTLEQRDELVTLERVGLGPTAPYARRGGLEARPLNAQQPIDLHALRIGT